MAGSQPPSQLRQRTHASSASKPLSFQASGSSGSVSPSSRVSLRWGFALVALLACSGLMRAMAQTNPFPSLAGAAGGGIPVIPPAETPPPCEGKTPARVIIDRVVAFPGEGQPTSITLRNVGGQTANISGWRLTDSDTRTVDAAMNLVFGKSPCDNTGNTTIPPAGILILSPKNDSNPCGYPFSLSFRDEVNLFDRDGKTVGSIKWGSANAGSSLRAVPTTTTLTASGSDVYSDPPQVKELKENAPVIETLQGLGGYSTFIEALQRTGLAAKLGAASDPTYPGPPPKPTGPEQIITPEFPWWFGFGVDRSKLPPPPPPPAPPPPPPPGIPAQGPYTILAPTDAAFDTLLTQLGNGRKLDKSLLLGLPELPDILSYHILGGRYTTGDMYNNTPIYTTKGVDVTPFNDPCMTEGRVMLHDGCVDKPTPDNFTCAEQATFDKCYFPFMTSALAAQWQGGFCQRTCQRCSCAPNSGITCAQIVAPDIYASNGVIQGITRVLFPPPVFNKTQAIAEAQAALAANPALAAQAAAMAMAPGGPGMGTATPAPGAPTTTPTTTPTTSPTTTPPVVGPPPTPTGAGPTPVSSGAGPAAGTPGALTAAPPVVTNEETAAAPEGPIEPAAAPAPVGANGNGSPSPATSPAPGNGSLASASPSPAP